MKQRMVERFSSGGGTLSIDGTDFEKNYARIGGGALEMHGGVAAEIVKSVFTRNSAVQAERFIMTLITERFPM